MATVSIHEASTNFSKLVDTAAKGEKIVIAKAGKPAPRLVSLETSPAARHFGALKGMLRIADDFDAPLPDELLLAFEGS
ncbi:type II toxin-antitoxin system Phd/YefM family antitoxin [Rugamonas sp. DEMB1]|uniref:type II toxin-antitoxin system Phd/YefM family antitoxin n=1 Tax=Rugamonas sp. DEMB1 TaxID=3039386 RepID=UPI002449A4CA|nr:type II toxin-antitoxin system Phd/YefM family antitoxin [Rugamonas sp. DEMB1]WGG48586.1 type II toxin-antitoxin system Phd/YefM family antitoxin [Rugamonas sp. DEMB1]